MDQEGSEEQLKEIERLGESRRIQARDQLDTHVEEKLRPVPKTSPAESQPSEDKLSQTPQK